MLLFSDFVGWDTIYTKNFQISGMNNADSGPPPAKPNIEFTPPKVASTPIKSAASSAVPQTESKKDAYGSIKETMENPEENDREEEDDCKIIFRGRHFCEILFCDFRYQPRN